MTRQRVRKWLKLERALLIEFKRLFGDVPHCNSHGTRTTASLWVDTRHEEDSPVWVHQDAHDPSASLASFRRHMREIRNAPKQVIHKDDRPDWKP